MSGIGDTDSLNGVIIIIVGLRVRLWQGGNTTGEERSIRSGKYASGKLFTGIAGDPNYDIATNKQGGYWRLPKPAEVEELIKKCNPTLTTKGTVSGWEFTASNGNKIFIPCVGVRTGEDDSSIEDLNKYAYIWSDSVASEGIYYEIAREPRQGESWFRWCVTLFAHDS